MTQMPQRQGLCNHCHIAWTWSLNIKLADQVCKSCNGKLTRVKPRLTEGSTYTWLTWEGYQ